jgi:hypothetical protein
MTDSPPAASLRHNPRTETEQERRMVEKRKPGSQLVVGDQMRFLCTFYPLVGFEEHGQPGHRVAKFLKSDGATIEITLADDDGIVVLVNPDDLRRMNNFANFLGGLLG